MGPSSVVEASGLVPGDAGKRLGITMVPLAIQSLNLSSWAEAGQKPLANKSWMPSPTSKVWPFKNGQSIKIARKHLGL